MPRTQGLHHLAEFLSVLRTVDETMPAQQMAVLVTVAQRPGLTMQELSETVGISQSSCSRNVAALGEWHRNGVPGHQLVEAIDDPRERRRKLIFLTGRGRSLVARVIAALTGQASTPFESITAKDFLNNVRRR